LSFINIIGRNNSFSECHAVYQGLLKELAMFEFQLINKLSLVLDTNESQNEQYIQLQNQREKEIQEAEKEIERLKDELKEARRNRQNLEEFESMAQKVLEYPSRDISIKQIGDLNKELELLTQETAATTHKFELKNKQFQLFLYALHQLQSQEEDDKPVTESNSLNINGNTSLNTVDPTSNTSTTVSTLPSIEVEKSLEKPDKMEVDGS